ncbi:hypothetical protein PXD04_00330 [Methanosphaera sp. ISO3-F5]|uniref:hypothetical protein n=1 Tax=Methanosphaera sp. ISO3-F5 TaxID=1452353 RepID=UPI002B26363E|nr:hypothetical protein [Methanosphaera sp. ISO3-F5]WQH64278.1 hypothetical protein PXD04_00330 [Methanosphaera sp. ISO3-F5]
MKTEKKIPEHKITIALENLEKEDTQVQKIFDKLENRTNTFLSISLGIFSLQVTLLTNTILNIIQEYIQQENVMMILLVLFMANILLNINAILNFRRSSKISEKIYTQGVMLKELLFGNFSEEEYVKEKFFNYQNYIMENEKKINYKKGYIIKGLNSILISMILLIIILIIIFVFI